MCSRERCTGPGRSTLPPICTAIPTAFPAGHTMASTICYVMLAFLVWMDPRVSPLVRRGVWVVSCALLAAIGFSRLYLGVHYPSDVLGGLTAGLGWLAVCGTTRRLLVARRGWEYGGW